MSAPAPDHGALLQRALDAIDEMEAKLEASERRHRDPIAVVGMGMRMPGGVGGPDELWELLMTGRDAVTEVPADRWDLADVYDPAPGTPGKSYTRWGAYLDEIDRFDATFFGISPREAASMDPQQRLLLEVAWETFEHAGIAPASLAGSSTGVFIGMTTTEYADLALQGGVMGNVDAYFASGVAHSVAAGRLAYAFDLHGPALSLDTACSSSLLSVHLAVRSLRAGECDAAMSGGVNLMLSPDGHILTSQARMMSFEGRCKTFDADADGYVRGEGCALVLLKRLSDAVGDGDRILAVIRGSAANQDGRSNGLTAPSAAAQEAVIWAALDDAGVEPAAIGFVECHGTGTTLGDPAGGPCAAGRLRSRSGPSAAGPVDQDQPRPPRGCRRHRRVLQAGARRPGRSASRPPPPHPAQHQHPVARHRGRARDGTGGVVRGRRRPPHRGHQLVRFQRHQRARRGGAGSGPGGRRRRDPRAQRLFRCRPAAAARCSTGWPSITPRSSTSGTPTGWPPWPEGRRPVATTWRNDWRWWPPILRRRPA